MMRPHAHVASAAILVAVAAAYYSFNWTSIRFASGTLASAGTLLIALSFLLGPLSRLKKGWNPTPYRKDFGLWGFIAVAAHAAIGMTLQSGWAFKAENLVSVTAAGISLLLFSLLAACSSDTVFRGLGEQKWRKIMRLGYVALAFSIVHFALLGKSYYLSMTIGQAVAAAVLVALLAKAVIIVRSK